jgi:hypothetical protein
MAHDGLAFANVSRSRLIGYHLKSRLHLIGTRGLRAIKERWPYDIYARHSLQKVRLYFAHMDTIINILSFFFKLFCL